MVNSQGRTWAARVRLSEMAASQNPLPVRIPRAKSPMVSSARASESEKAYSPAIVEKRLPPSIVKVASKRKGSVASARAAGIGRGARNSRPIA